MMRRALEIARSSAVKWALKSLLNFLDRNSMISCESEMSSPFKVIQGVLPFGLMGSSKSFWNIPTIWWGKYCWEWYCVLIPRRECWPCANMSLASKEMGKCWEYFYLWLFDVGLRHFSQLHSIFSCWLLTLVKILQLLYSQYSPLLWFLIYCIRFDRKVQTANASSNNEKIFVAGSRQTRIEVRTTNLNNLHYENVLSFSLFAIFHNDWFRFFDWYQ